MPCLAVRACVFVRVLTASNVEPPSLRMVFLADQRQSTAVWLFDKWVSDTCAWDIHERRAQIITTPSPSVYGSIRL